MESPKPIKQICHLLITLIIHVLFSGFHVNNTYIVHVHLGFLAKTSDGLKCINKLLFTFFKTDK